ncbi:MAG: Imm21 family immunity protein [Polyangiaceae bacterium]
MKPIECVVSGGGPILVIPSDLSPLWRGTSPPVGAAVPPGWTWGTGGVVCDYDRACDDVEDPFDVGATVAGTLPVGSGRALVLDGELSTAALPWGDGVMIVRTPPFDTEEAARAALATVDPAAFSTSAHVLETSGGRLFVFDSAYEGAAAAADIGADGGVLDVPLAPGRYRVDHAALPHSAGGTFALLRLSRQP